MINLKTKNWEIENIKAVIFDKDGTIIDLHYFWGKMTELRCEEIIKKFNLDATIKNNLCLFLGYDLTTKKMLADGITAIYSRPKIIELFIEELKKYNINTTREEIENIFDKVSDEFYKNIEKYTKLIPNVKNFIDNLYKNNIQMAIVTSDSIVSTNLMIKQFNLEKYFKIVIGRESSKYNKESGIPTKLAIEKLNINPENIVMIGDTKTDFISAKLANIDKTILCATGQVKIDELKLISDYCVNSLDEIEIE